MVACLGAWSIYACVALLLPLFDQGASPGLSRQKSEKTQLRETVDQVRSSTSSTMMLPCCCPAAARACLPERLHCRLLRAFAPTPPCGIHHVLDLISQAHRPIPLNPTSHAAQVGAGRAAQLQDLPGERDEHCAAAVRAPREYAPPAIAARLLVFSCLCCPFVAACPCDLAVACRA